MDFAPSFQMGHPIAFQAPRGCRELPDRPGPGVLDQFRLGERRHGAEDRARLPAGARRGAAEAADRARARLSRRGLRRHVGRRHRAEPQAVRRPAALRRPPAAHAQPRRATPSARGSRRGARIWPTRSRAWWRCTATPSRPSWSSRWPAAPACWCRRRATAAPARALHQARHPADLRRGHHRLRPPGHEFRARSLRRDPGHDDDGQGPDQRGGADGRGGRQHAKSTTRSWTAARPAIELFHGYTYSGHPLASAAAIATLDIYRREDLPAGPRRSSRIGRTRCTRCATRPA